MSHWAAFKQLDRRAMLDFLREKGIHLLSGGLDEALLAYKDINEVVAAQSDLVDIVARFEPRLLKMAPPAKTTGVIKRKNADLSRRCSHDSSR